ncbi:hypothetical protein WJX72_010671 [[Myrmecia] bisecta]|uniref:Uncharacterized protein n=1 Tax=[Myrmecia] bisecta TaxID=41462 RepID=A0AAW1P7S7_9CHLO
MQAGPAPNNGKLPPLPRQAFAAYEEPRQQAEQKKSRAWKVWLVAGDCFLIGLQPVLVHMSKNAQGRFSFHPVSVNFMVEVAKTLFATIVLLIYGTDRPGVPMTRSLRSFIRDAHHNQLLAIPAGLYAVNNYLKFAMQLYFKPTTAKMLGNLKILVIAVLMKWVMKRTFTVFQWEALVLLVAGITVNQLNYCSKDSTDTLAVLAVVYTLGSVTVPSLASVYNEFALKKHMDTSVHLQNFFLYFYGACFNGLGVLMVMAFNNESLASLFRGHSKITLLLVVNNALQGILSSFFFKYADTILKKYSSTMATIFTGLMSAVLFGHHLTSNFCIGVSIVFISMHQFFSQGGVKGVSKDKSAQRPIKFTPSPSLDNMRSDSVESLTALEASIADPDNQHLLNPRRMVLPRTVKTACSHVIGASAAGMSWFT